MVSGKESKKHVLRTMKSSKETWKCRSWHTLAPQYTAAFQVTEKYAGAECWLCQWKRTSSRSSTYGEVDVTEGNAGHFSSGGVVNMSVH